mmetsp:Transcript_3904/g.11053  ORF Transcript_3904/g.11053 Transcript_3904/m.11053 type:complete len:576 (+) Transcript_3904:61-1788(+)
MIFAVAETVRTAAAAGQVSTFAGCHLAEYYQDILGGSASPPTRQALHDKLRTTHRKSLPYTSSYASDTWDALLDLDGVIGAKTGAEDRVKLIYASDETIAAEPRGTSDTWNREHIYPKSAGVGTGGPDYTDVFALKPSLARVNSARGNKWFGQCGIEDGGGTCRRPAHELAAEDTETDSSAWMPPANTRGDVARAMFYMSLRYDGDGYELDLALSDCPDGVMDDGQANELGYLSELLRWHMEDPVDEEERLRNDRICHRWQGNRNPFIDHPDWVETYFGKPATLIGDGGGYASCRDNADEEDVVVDVDESQTPPTEAEGDAHGDTPASFDGASCNGLEIGDIAVIAAGSDDPDSFQLLALTDIHPGSEFYVTDNAFTGYRLRDNEGTIKFKVKDVILAGSVIVYDKASPEWEAVGGSFSLSASGDTIIVYCTNGSEGESGITFLSALSYSGDFLDPNEDENVFGSSKSALPPLEIESGDKGFFSFLTGVQFAATALEHEDNVWYDSYNAPNTGTKSDLWIYLADPALWGGSNTEMPLIRSDFVVLVEDVTSGSTGLCGGLSWWLLLVLISWFCRR